MRLPRSPLSAIGLLALVWMGPSPLFGEPPVGWKLVFSDEFDGQTLDTSKWNTTMEFVGTQGPRYHNEYYLSYTLDEDAVVSDGMLHLRTERHTVSGTEPMGLFGYSQGVVTTQDKFDFTYGYVEIRAKYPGGKGLWPCFWLMPQDPDNWPPEFDIAEYHAGQHRMHHGLAYGPMAAAKWDSSNDTETDFVNNWHTFALEWTRGRAVWYVDGVPCKTVTADYVPSVPMYVILSNSVASRLAASGEPDEKTVFPNDFQIDYIHIYQEPPPQMLAKAEPSKLPAPVAEVKPPAPEAKPRTIEPKSQTPETKPIIAVLPVTPLP